MAKQNTYYSFLLLGAGDVQAEGTNPAYISMFNMWSYEMNSTEINSKTCEEQGDVVSWKVDDLYWGTLQEKEETLSTDDLIPRCSGTVYI